MLVFDCFQFFNELDLLEIRLNELDCVVDYFVLSESVLTHAGNPKPLYYDQNKDRFKKWRNRIIHVVVEDMPAVIIDEWCRERHQRDCVTRGIMSRWKGSDDDIIIIGDADEIARASCVEAYNPASGPIAFNNIMCYYWLNCFTGWGQVTRVMSAKDYFAYPTASAARIHQDPSIDNAGWHFSYLGGPGRIQEKLEAFAHQEHNNNRIKDFLPEAVNEGINIYDRTMKFTWVPVTEEWLPAYVVANQHKFKHLIWEGPKGATSANGSPNPSKRLSVQFNEDWYADSQLVHLAHWANTVRPLSGAVIEIGCWEGKSTIALCNAVYPEVVLAVDTWEGNCDEKPDHVTVIQAQERDIYAQFLVNVAGMTRNNVNPVMMDCHEFLARFDEKVKFCHIDASHDYNSVKRTIEALLPKVVDGGVLCGDDIAAADATRKDLNGGVERAVRELLPGFFRSGNFWVWVKK